MNDNTTIEINADTFCDGNSYFVRTEIAARSVNVHGPFPDHQTAQKLKAGQLASRAKVSEALNEQLQRVNSALAAAAR
jgi:hypothetical protein